MLEDHADLAPDAQHLVLAGLGDVHAIPDDLTGGWLNQAVDAAQQGGFPRTAQSDNCQEFPRLYCEADIIQRQDVPRVDFYKILYFEHKVITLDLKFLTSDLFQMKMQEDNSIMTCYRDFHRD